MIPAISLSGDLWSQTSGLGPKADQGWERGCPSPESDDSGVPEDTWLTQEPPSLGSATRAPQDREIGRGLNSKAFNLQLACLFLALVLPVAMPHPNASTSPTPFPCPCSSLGAWTHLPGLLGGSRWGCRQSSCCPQHQHGQGLRPRGVDLLMPV